MAVSNIASAPLALVGALQATLDAVNAASGDNTADITALQSAVTAAEAAIQALQPAVVQRTTLGQTNANNSTAGTDIEWNAPTDMTAGTYLAPSGQETHIIRPGLYRLTAGVFFTSTVARTNVGLRTQLDFSTGDGPQSGSAYIRALNGHNEASSHITPWIFRAPATVTVAAPLRIEIAAYQLAAAGTVNISPDVGYMLVERVGE